MYKFWKIIERMYVSLDDDFSFEDMKEYKAGHIPIDIKDTKAFFFQAFLPGVTLVIIEIIMTVLYFLHIIK